MKGFRISLSEDWPLCFHIHCTVFHVKQEITKFLDGTPKGMVQVLTEKRCSFLCLSLQDDSYFEGV